MPYDRSAVITSLRTAGCVFAEEEAELLLSSACDQRELDTMVARRVAGVPIEHVVGWVEFCGLRVEVDDAVFVPRQRTQVLARLATSSARPGATVVDLCCGSGAIGLVIATSVSGVRLFASDISEAAIRCAQRNLAHLDAHVVRGDLFAALSPALVGTVEVLVANVPYVPTTEVVYLPAEAREHEPLVALDGGADGLDVLRAIAAQALSWLAVGGQLFVETSLEQADVASAVMVHAGLRASVVVDDDYDVAVVIGTRVA